MTNYLDELMKVAEMLPEETEPMNPDPMPPMADDEVAAIQTEGAELAAEQLPESYELTAEEAALSEQIKEAEADEAISQSLIEKVANEAMWLGAISKLIHAASGSEDIPEELAKHAHDMIDQMTMDEDSFKEGIAKIAEEISSNEDNINEVYSAAGYHYMMEQVAHLEELDKQADEDGSALSKLRAFAGEAVENVKNKVTEAVDSAKNLKQIGAEIDQVAEKIAPFQELDAQGVPAVTHASAEDLEQYRQLNNQHADLLSRQRAGRTAIGVGGGALAAGALYGGKKLYDYTHQPPSEEEKVAHLLPAYRADGTLETERTNENGGMDMLSVEFLKIAGCAALVDLANDESVDMGLRKEASDTFEYIANLGESQMGEEFAKVAMNLFQEEELHEIVAGNHTNMFLDKVAFFTEAAEMPADELYKVANAGGVAAGRVGGMVNKATENIKNVIDKSKEAVQGGHRTYMGALKGHKGKGMQAGAIAGTTGLAGGGLVGGLQGYKALTNPSEYDMEQTAQALEEAYHIRKTAAESFDQANQFINQYSHLFQ